MENHNIDNSQGAQRPPIHVVNGEAKPSKGRKQILLSFLTLVLVAGIGATGYLYSQEKSAKQDHDSRVAALNSEIASIKHKATEEAKAAEAKEAAETVYTAEVGKFTLSLPSEYYVVEQIDGAYEGGPITQASIGFPTDEENVINADMLKTVGIYARPSEQKNFDQDVENEVGKDAKKSKSIKIDGVSADVYEVSGLTDSRSVVFNNNNIFYRISSTVKNKDTNTLIDEVVEGFEFN